MSFVDRDRPRDSAGRLIDPGMLVAGTVWHRVESVSGLDDSVTARCGWTVTSAQRRAVTMDPADYNSRRDAFCRRCGPTPRGVS